MNALSALAEYSIIRCAKADTLMTQVVIVSWTVELGPSVLHAPL